MMGMGVMLANAMGTTMSAEAVFFTVALMLLMGLIAVAIIMARSGEKQTRALAETLERVYRAYYEARREREEANGEEPRNPNVQRRLSQYARIVESLQSVLGASTVKEAGGEVIRCPRCGMPLVAIGDGLYMCPERHVYRLEEYRPQSSESEDFQQPKKK